MYLVCRFKGDTKLEESEKIIFEQDGDTYRLVIREAQITESGSYTVKATNEVSSVTTQAKLKVKGGRLNLSLESHIFSELGWHQVKEANGLSCVLLYTHSTSKHVYIF